VSGFTKLYSSIVLSTVWREPNHVRIVWITMLALADAGGHVEASVPGLADAARVTIAECEEALAAFQRPDPYSRTKDHDGKRIEPIDGGWRLLNYTKYREGRDPEKRREQNREAQARHRARLNERQPRVSQSKPDSAQAEAEAEAEAEEPEREGAHAPVAAAAAPAPLALDNPSSTKKAASRKPRRTSKRWTRVPDDFVPNAEHREIANKRSVNLDEELAKFRDHEFPKPKSDVNATFRNWLRNARPTHPLSWGKGPRPMQPPRADDNFTLEGKVE
jgi:hypothetical protein